MRKTRVFIYGSCVSRDTFEFLDPAEFELVHYVARQSAISAYTKPVELISPPALDSRFKQRVVEDDFSSSLRETIASLEDIDLVLMDLTDERLGVYVLPDGSVITRSVELIESGAEQHLPHGSHHIPFGSDLHLQYWSTGISEVAKLFHEYMPRTAIALLGIPWASYSEDGTPTPDSFGMSASQINPVMRSYVDYAASTVGARLIDVNSDLVRSKPDHPWGNAPFHYSTSVYLDVTRSLTGRDGRDPWSNAPGSAVTSDTPSGTELRADADTPPDAQGSSLSSTNVLHEAHVTDPQKPTLVYLESVRELTADWPFRDALVDNGTNYVRIADPTLTDHPDLTFGWGIGGRHGAGTRRIIDTVRECVGESPLIFAGTGPMGYSAVRCGLESDSPILVHNPDLLWNTSDSESVQTVLAHAGNYGLSAEHPQVAQLSPPSRPVRLLASANTAGPTARTRVIPGLLTLLNDGDRISQSNSTVSLFSDPKSPYSPWTPKTLVERLQEITG
ncbi:DUF6270 domain-containing protein [Isoptericola sediminis]|uniref:Uncharacterized protein n=1 Tax=Isoptericola sediminis TaxID=2733572 RepID=A0A849JW81_9MICO|nr:DUF6270 domain-containing protein [Isoptericola sediminis]NNU27552.1 hypothetical protein [Isoptericola sediminis]